LTTRIQAANHVNRALPTGICSAFPGALVIVNGDTISGSLGLHIAQADAMYNKESVLATGC
jgi:hypothetical protein